MTALEFIRQQIPHGWRQTPSGWISGNCPMCAARGHRPDTRRRGGIMFVDDKFQYNCFNCGYKTGWSPGKRINDRLKDLLVQFGTDPAQVQRVNFELLKQAETENIAKQFLPIATVEQVKVYWKEHELPPYSKLLQDVDTSSLDDEQLEKFIVACEYISTRSLDFYDKWHWSPHSHFANRVILPFYHNNTIVGYTARWTLPDRPAETPKYFLQSPKNFVYNLDAQTTHDYVIVTEGQLDALLVGGIALNGNTPNATQCSIIDQLDKQVILLPDFDKAGMETVKAAIRRGWSVSFPPWENCKDAGDAVAKYGRLFTVRSILDSAETSSTKIQILAKQHCK